MHAFPLRKAIVYEEKFRTISAINAGFIRKILECHLVSGDFHYLLKVRIADMASYRELLGEILHALPGVRDSRTLVAMETVQESTALIVRD